MAEDDAGIKNSKHTSKKYIIASAIIIVIIIAFLAVKFFPETTFSEDSIEKLKTLGWNLTEEVKFYDLDEYGKMQWGTEFGVGDGAKWILEKENEELSIRHRVFSSSESAKAMFDTIYLVKDKTKSHIQDIQDFEFKDRAFSALFLDLGRDALLIIIQDGETLTEVAYSNVDKHNYDEKNYEGDILMLTKLSKDLWKYNFNFHKA